MNTTEQVLADVNRVVCEVLTNDTIRLAYETKADEVKDWDSLNHIQIVLAVEKHFGIRFNFAELQKFKNVGEMCDNIVLKLAAKNPQT